MEDEIKEILDRLKDDTYVPLEDGRDYKLLYKDDDKLLLDYITNLQKEVLNYRKLGFKFLNDQNIKLQQENKKLKHNLEQMYNDTKDTYFIICAEQVDYKSRCEKAIEKFKKAFDYRNNISVNNWEYDGGEEEYIEMLESAYNTLQGDDKDVN